MTIAPKFSAPPFAELFDATPEATLVCLPDGRVAAANAAASALLGYSREELVGLSFWSVVDDADSGSLASFQELAAVGLSTIECRHRRRDGSVFDARTSSTRFAAADGSAWWRLTIVDTSSAAAAAADGDTIHRNIVAAMFEGVVMQDKTGRIFASNASAETILGMTREQLLGRTSLDPGWRAVREDGSDFPGHEHPAMVALATGEPVRNVIMGVRHARENVTWIRVNSTPIFAPGETLPYGAVTTFDDITERVEMQRALRDSEARIRALIDNVPVLVSYWDREQRCRLANASHLEWYGIDPVTMLGMTFRDVVGEQRYAERQPFIEAVLRGERATYERELRDAAGVLRRVQGTYLPDAPHGRVVGFFALLTDVTELNRVVELRTRELLVAKNDAETANRTKDEFIANVSHEMRTPLHAIKAYTRLAQMSKATAADDKLVGYLQRIDASNLRLTHFVESILSISSYENDKVRPMWSEVDLREAVTGVGRIMAPIFQERSQHLQLVPGSAPSSVSADPKMVEQVITNLLANASRFSPPGSLVAVELAAETIRADDAQACPREAIRISVFDQGIGIPEEELQLIFEKFHQSTRTRSSSGGTGLGLAICREILKLHGGRIAAANNDGGGARFDVWFPVQRTAQSAVSATLPFHEHR